MARACTVCTSVDHDAIDAAAVAGVPFRRISARYQVSATAVRRHVRGHLTPSIVALQDAQEEERGQTLAERLEGLYRRAERILDAADQGQRGQLSLSAIRELRGIAELLGRLSGELRDGGVQVAVVSVAASAEWQAIRSAVMRGLEGYPEAKASVVEQLRVVPSYSEPAPVRHGRAAIAPWRPPEPPVDADGQAALMPGGDDHYNVAEGEDDDGQ